MNIRLGTENDIESIRQISNIQLGASYLNKSDLNAYLRSDNSNILVATEDNSVCGFSIFLTSDYRGILNEIGVEHDDLLKIFNRFQKIRLKKTTVVDPNYTGLGIGSTLTKAAEQYESENIDLILTLNWKRADDFPMNSISQKLSYSILGEIALYWKEMSLRKGFLCPECGEPPCTCSAVILFRKENR